MAERQRVMLQVIVSLDPVPGAFHTPESARDSIDALLLTRIRHYDPVVFLSEEN